MNSVDKLELLRLAKENVRLQRLIAKHEGYKERIKAIRKRRNLTSQEEQEVFNLKLKKLQSKDEMIRIARTLKGSAQAPKLNSDLGSRTLHA